MTDSDHPNKESALILFGVIGAASIFPFCVIRALNHEWLMAFVDLLLSTTCIGTAGYVYKTGKTYFPQLVMTIIIVLGVSFLINYVGG